VASTDEFAHGYHYGDYSGVVFYGPPTNGFWLDRLAVSDIYMGALLRAVLDRSWRESGGEAAPRLASEWNTLDGWAAAGAGITEVPPAAAEDLVAALAGVTAADLAPHCAGCTPDECLRCGAAVREFLASRLARGVRLFIEDD
jgi:hypothetical protein